MLTYSIVLLHIRHRHMYMRKYYYSMQVSFYMICILVNIMFLSVKTLIFFEYGNVTNYSTTFKAYDTYLKLKIIIFKTEF